MLPGDILLVKGDGKLSKSLVTAQKIIYSDVISSHVEFSLGDGIFIHATNDKGVHLTLLVDEDLACRQQWRVIRHKSISESGPEVEKLQKAAIYYYGQDYNKAFMGSGTNCSSFCSELVAKAFTQAEIKIIDGKEPSKVTPAHFDKEADELENWIDVTEEYKKILADMKMNPFHYKLAASTLSAAMSRRRAHEKVREGILEMLSNGSPKSKNASEEMKEMLKGRELKFWHEKYR